MSSSLSPSSGCTCCYVFHPSLCPCRPPQFLLQTLSPCATAASSQMHGLASVLSARLPHWLSHSVVPPAQACTAALDFCFCLLHLSPGFVSCPPPSPTASAPVSPPPPPAHSTPVTYLPRGVCSQLPVLALSLPPSPQGCPNICLASASLPHFDFTFCFPPTCLYLLNPLREQLNSFLLLPSVACSGSGRSLWKICLTWWLLPSVFKVLDSSCVSNI